MPLKNYENNFSNIQCYQSEVDVLDMGSPQETLGEIERH